MQMKRTGLVNKRPEPTTIRATIRIAKLATTNAPITDGLTRLLMAAYWVAFFPVCGEDAARWCDHDAGASRRFDACHLAEAPSAVDHFQPWTWDGRMNMQASV
jgi:hypothetical protein